jgi:cation transport protein ChaC
MDGKIARVFAYGSLLWNPGFEYEQKTRARLDGYHRAFCRLSIRHRGTPAAPGMVVGLKPGGSCEGICYSVLPAHLPSVLDYLDEREGAGYRREAVPIWLPAAGPRGTVQSEAYTYLPEPGHPTYVPDLPESEIVLRLTTGVGRSGRARDYLKELVDQLERLGIDEPQFRRMLSLLAPDA